MKSGWLKLTGFMFVVVACDGAPEPPPAPDPGMRMPPPEWARGTWVVTGHTIPGVSAMSDVEAAAWGGRVLQLADTVAIGHETRCADPSYRESLDSNDSLTVSHAVAIGELPLRGSSSTVLEILCGGERWTAFGGQLIVLHPDTVLVPWDGVFFVLGRR